MSEEASEIQINVKGPSELKLQISISPDKTVLELKQAIAAKSDVEADRQRLIYSGRVLKDEEPLSAYKIQSSHTIHMVKGVSRSGGAASSSTGSGTTAGAAPQQLPTMQTGQNVHDPLTQLNSHLGFGAMAGLNPFGEMGLNPNDPNMMQSMLNSPQFLQQMSSLLSNPAIMEQVIASNPQLAAIGPQVRAALQDEGFRQMISNPETFQQMMRLSSMMGGGMGGGSPFGGSPSPFGGFGFPNQQQQSSFPAPGTPNPNPNSTSPSTTSPSSTTSTSPSSTNNTTTQTPPINPFSLFGGLGGPPAGTGAGSPGAGTAPNPFGTFNPNLMQQMLYGGYGPGAGGLGGYGGFGAQGQGLGGAPAQPADTRPPEERFQVQLQQLQDMGFTNASQNVRALLATGGNVQGAIDYIFGGGGV